MKKILLVDDDPEIHNTLGYYLKEKGFEVISITNAFDAPSILAKGDIAIAIIDILMPEVDGYLLCDIISKNIDSRLPIIIYSCLGDKSDIIQGFDHGAKAYLVKPTPFQKIVQTIEYLIKDKAQDKEKST